MELVCDKCKCEFAAKTAIEMKTSGEFTYQWLRCPKCKKIYPIAVIDNQIRENIERLKQLQKRLGKEVRNKVTHRKTESEFTKLQKKNKAYGEKLLKEHISKFTFI